MTNPSSSIHFLLQHSVSENDQIGEGSDQGNLDNKLQEKGDVDSLETEEDKGKLDSQPLNLETSEPLKRNSFLIESTTTSKTLLEHHCYRHHYHQKHPRIERHQKRETHQFLESSSPLLHWNPSPQNLEKQQQHEIQTSSIIVASSRGMSSPLSPRVNKGFSLPPFSSLLSESNSSSISSSSSISLSLSSSLAISSQSLNSSPSPPSSVISSQSSSLSSSSLLQWSSTPSLSPTVSILSSNRSSIDTPSFTPSSVPTSPICLSESHLDFKHSSGIGGNNILPISISSPSVEINPLLQTFRLLIQPSEIQRKSYKNENRFLLPNPIIVGPVNPNFPRVDGIVIVKLVDDSQTEIQPENSNEPVLEGLLAKRLDASNQTGFSLKCPITSKGRNFHLMFTVNYKVRIDTPEITETILSVPFKVTSNKKRIGLWELTLYFPPLAFVFV